MKLLIALALIATTFAACDASWTFTPEWMDDLAASDNFFAQVTVSETDGESMTHYYKIVYTDAAAVADATAVV